MTAMHICEGLWIAFFVIWMIWAIGAKPTQIHEGISSRLSYMVLTIAAFWVMFSSDVPREWLRVRIFPSTLWVDAVGIFVTLAGLAFAVWARAYLGGNWSSSVTVKVNHQLIRSGPYRWVRHPIYSGMILAMLGTALVRAQVRGLVAVVLLYMGFKIKSKIEEQAMTTTFGAEYAEYSRSTGAIVPRLRI